MSDGTPQPGDRYAAVGDFDGAYFVVMLVTEERVHMAAATIRADGILHVRPRLERVLNPEMWRRL